MRGVVSRDQATRAALQDIVLSGLLVLCAAKLTLAAGKHLDIALQDETSYLATGLRLRFHGELPSANWNPFMAVWYSALSRLVVDPIDLFYLSLRAMATLLPVVLFWFLRRVRVSPAVAFALAFFFLISAANLPMTPKSNHLATIVIFAGFIAATFFRFPGRWPFFTGLGLLLASYVRGEHLPMAYVAMAWLVVETGRELARPGLSSAARVKATLPLAAMGGITFFLFRRVGNPLVGSRLWDSFGAHFAVNWVSWTGSDLFPWTNWEAICAKAFPGARTVSAAFLANPVAMLRHLALNVVHFFPETLDGLFDHYPLLLPGRKRALARAETWILIAVTAAFLVAKRRAALDLCRAAVRKCREGEGVCLILATLMTFVIAVAIYPHCRYLVPVLFLGYLGIGKLVDRTALRLPHPVALAVVAFLATPAIDSDWMAGTTAGQPIKETILYLRGLKLKPSSRYVVFEDSGGYTTYLGDNFARIEHYTKDRPWKALVAEKGIGIVVLGELGRDDARLKDDPDFQEFLRNPHAQGFRLVGRVSASDVWVREDLDAAA